MKQEMLPTNELDPREGLLQRYRRLLAAMLGPRPEQYLTENDWRKAVASHERVLWELCVQEALLHELAMLRD